MLGYKLLQLNFTQLNELRLIAIAFQNILESFPPQYLQQILRGNQQYFMKIFIQKFPLEIVEIKKSIKQIRNKSPSFLREVIEEKLQNEQYLRLRERRKRIKKVSKGIEIRQRRRYYRKKKISKIEEIKGSNKSRNEAISIQLESALQYFPRH